ncbi:phage protease [Vibrio parahaemolyticus]|uniref:phage protease n=1 Tax=Vibrio parahaemolyticus TaxID=670 RepID=UPI0038916DE1
MSSEVAYCSEISEQGLSKNPVLPIQSVIETVDHRKFKLVDPVKVIKQSMRKDGVDMLVDYEHESTSMHAQQGIIAAGWIKKLYLSDSHIMADIEWTKKAKELIKNKEFRYLSPTLAHDENGVILKITSVALCKQPALPLEANLSQINTKQKSLNDLIIDKYGVSESEIISNLSKAERDAIENDVSIAVEKHWFPKCVESELSLIRQSIGRESFLSFTDKMSNLGFSHLKQMQSEKLGLGIKDFSDVEPVHEREARTLAGLTRDEFLAAKNKG